MTTENTTTLPDSYIIENYEELALRTAPKDYFPIVERATASRGLLSSILYDIAEVGRDADKLKKQLFYGKPQDFGEIENYNFTGDGFESRISNPVVIDLVHAILGLSSEVAEIVDALELHLLNGGELDLVNIGEEQGDLEWYESLLTKVTKVSSNQARIANIRKLMKRYPNGFTQHDAVTRNLRAERAQLEADLT